MKCKVKRIHTDEETIENKVQSRTIDESAKPVIRQTLIDGVQTAWDRFEMQQPPCSFCSEGISCQRCAMGPCRLMGETRDRGVCGADADLIVSRNLLDTMVTGSAAHSDHGREIVETLLKVGEGATTGYKVTDKEKLRRVAGEFGLDTSKATNEVAKGLAMAMIEEYGMTRGRLQFTERAPEQTRAIWEKVGIMPRGADREVVEGMHRIHMGVGQYFVNLLLHGLRTSLSDGWGGSMIATEVSDILLGTPEVIRSKVNLGTMKRDHVNIAVHGHIPMLADMVIRTAEMPEMVERAKNVGAKGINIVGLCCTGNEVLMRLGVPQAGNHLNQELIIATGALELMTVDYQCIFPTLAQTASCFHTRIVSTSEKSKMVGSTYMEYTPESAEEVSRDIVTMAIDNFPNRNPDKVNLPTGPMDMMAGFSVEAIKKALGGTWTPLIDAIKAGKVRGCVGIVGCNNPKIKHDFGHVELAKELIKHDVLVVETGCAAIATAKAGLMRPESADMAGPGLREVCKALGIPPVLHMGSCVDNSRILVLAAELANELGVGMHQLPVAGAAPEWYSQKAVSIAAYFVASGIYTVLGVMPKITGSQNVVNLLTKGLNDVVKASFAVESDPTVAGQMIIEHIESKRKELGI